MNLDKSLRGLHKRLGRSNADNYGSYPVPLSSAKIAYGRRLVGFRQGYQLL
jgi:hypothetical protein